MSRRYRIEALAKLDRQSFCSGSESLDRYFHRQVTQDIRRNLSACFVAICAADNSIAGYYTLSATSVALSNIPEELSRRLPNYPHLPAALIGRLAVDQNHQGQRLGTALLINAISRTISTEMGIYTLLVDAKDDVAQRFCQHHNFTLLPDPERRLMLPIATARKLLGS